MLNHDLHHVKKSIAVYPGSFDPITNGHLDIIERATYLFDEVVVLVAVNEAKLNKGLFTPKERARLITESINPEFQQSVRVDVTEGFVATVDVCTNLCARAMIRGLRSVTDFDSEFELAIANMELAPHIETVFMVPQPVNHFISSSKVREILKLRGPDSVAKFIPEAVLKTLKSRESDA